MSTPEYSREEYANRLWWLMTGRVILLSFLLITLLFFQYRYQIYHLPAAYLYLFFGIILTVSLVYRSLLKRVGNLSLFAYVQISGDILLVTVLVYLTGGIESGLSILYHLSIISATIILSRRGGLLSASLSSILYGGMLDMQYYNMPGFLKSQSVTSMQVFYQVFVNIVSFYIVAFLSSYLSERLRTARRELREKSLDFEDLRSLQDHILKSVGSGILTMDLSGQITSWNPAAENITGYSAGEIRTNMQAVFGESIRNIFGHTREMHDRSFRFESRVMKKNGSSAVLGMTASLLKDDRGAVRGIILVFQDITRLVEMEEKVRRQERMATVGNLAAGIAHEIRNPLASLSGSIQLLQSELDLKGDDRDLMNIVLRETDRLNTIISEFLEYARPRPPDKEQIRLSALIDETLTLLRNSPVYGKGVVIDVAVDPSIRILADPRQLRQIFWNLLLNACQAVGETGKISISAKEQASAAEVREWCEIAVADTGCGIPRENIAKLFDPFFTTKSGGSGLGLAIIYRIIEDHEGTITVDSEVGKGTTIRIRLPLEETMAPRYAGK